MKIAILLPSLKKKGPVILAFDIISKLEHRVEKIDVYYFSDCIDPYTSVRLDKVKYVKISFFKALSFKSYDIVHCHSFRPDLYTYIFKNKILPPVVTTIHNYVFDELYYTYNKIISLIFSKIWITTWNNKNAIIFLTKHMKEYYLSLAKFKPKLVVINNGRSIEASFINTSNLNVTSLVTEAKKKYKIIGCCGFLNKRKGFEDLIHFLSLNTSLYAVFIGDGPDRNRLVTLAKSLNVFDRCLFLGSQKNSLEIMSKFDFYIMSSYSEGFPLVLLEAGGIGIPILCVNSPLFRELFSDDQVVFYERHNCLSMKKSLDKISLNKDIYSRNIKNVIQEQYSSDKMAENYFNLFIYLNRN